MTSDFDAIAAAGMEFFHASMGESAAVTLVDGEGVSGPPIDAILGDIRREVLPSETGEFDSDVVVERMAIRISGSVLVDMYSAVQIRGDTDPWAIESVTDKTDWQQTVNVSRQNHARFRRQGLTKKVT